MMASALPKPSSTFLDLPAEIRNPIYKHVFAGSTIKISVRRFEVAQYQGPEDYRLLQASHHIYREARPILAASITLVLTGGHGDDFVLYRNTLKHAPFLNSCLSYLRRIEINSEKIKINYDDFKAVSRVELSSLPEKVPDEAKSRLESSSAESWILEMRERLFVDTMEQIRRAADDSAVKQCWFRGIINIRFHDDRGVDTHDMRIAVDLKDGQNYLMTTKPIGAEDAVAASEVA